MKKSVQIAGFLLAIAGGALGVILMWLHGAGLNGAGWLAEICGAGGGCDSVLRSRWAYFPPSETGATVSVALPGVMYFTAAAVWFAFLADRPGWTRKLAAAAVVMGAAGSVALLAVMFFAVKGVCPWCLATHGVNFAMAGLILWRRDWIDSAERQPVAAAGALTACLWALAIVGQGAISLSVENKALTVALDEWQRDAGAIDLAFYGQEAVEIGIDADDAVIDAEPGYRNTLVIFGDAECPACRRFHRLVDEEIRPLYGNHLRVVFKHLPLTDSHPNAMEAALALDAAREQGKFWTLLAALYDRQGGLAGLDYGALAVELGMDRELFLARMESEEAMRRVLKDVELAQSLKIEGTPAAFLNGRRVTGSIRNLTAFWEGQAEKLRQLREEKGEGWKATGMASH